MSPRSAKSTAKGRKEGRRQAAPAPSEAAHQKARAAAASALGKKAEEVLILDVRGLTSYAEFFVIMSGSSSRQVNAVAESISVDLKRLGHQLLGTEGAELGQWVLLDFGDVVVHVFSPEVRAFYDLESLWADAPRERIDG